LRFLIVDDNASFLEASRTLLERHGLTVVGVASDSASARQRAAELTPDVALVDIDLGEESGFDVARQLAASPTSAHVKVILISTHPEDDFAELVAESPAVGFIGKSDLSAASIAELLDDNRQRPTEPPEM
jgi:two-component system, NarL family, nitrate/nitrite response regulator NarL